MDDFLKSKTDLVRRWKVETVKAILADAKNVSNIAFNLLCNPFISDEVYLWLLERYGRSVKEEWIKAQTDYTSFRMHPTVLSASVEGTTSMLMASSIKLEASDGELRKMICTLMDNEPIVNDLYSLLFQ